MVRDELDKDITKFEIWILDVIDQTREQTKNKKERCEVCNSKEDQEDLELHHIAGRKYDPRTVTVCKPCHQILSKWQTIWQKSATVKPEELGPYYFWVGLRDLLMLKAEKTNKYLLNNFAVKVLCDLNKIPEYFVYDNLCPHEFALLCERHEQDE